MMSSTARRPHTARDRGGSVRHAIAVVASRGCDARPNRIGGRGIANRTARASRAVISISSEARPALCGGSATRRCVGSASERQCRAIDVSNRRLRLAKLALAIAVASAAAWLLPGRPALAAEPDAAKGWIANALSFVLHLDKYLSGLVSRFGAGRTYGILTAIVFCETGLVVTPFLPGDSLLFAAGAFAALGVLEIRILLTTLFAAAVVGDALNYAIGAWIGRRVIDAGLIAPKHIAKTEAFYAKYGGKTVVLARFVPIVRTFAPFVAGIGSMRYADFAFYNIAGAALWVIGFTLLGFFFGNLPAVQHNFTAVVLAIVAVSVLPIVYEIWKARAEGSTPPQ